MGEYLLPYQPSLAQSTNTRLDSACKHIQQCRVSTDDMMRYVNNDAEELQRNKYRYCVHKDEFAVGIGRPWNPQAVLKRTINSAYPKIISNLGGLGDDSKGEVAINMIRFMNHYARDMNEKRKIIQYFKDGVHTEAEYLDGGRRVRANGMELFKNIGNAGERKIATPEWLSMMCDFIPVGFANTIGYAHANNGDTMSSIMIGGLRTVMNGDFEIFPGDLVQFYWTFEVNDFDREGRRKPYKNIWLGGNQIGNLDPRCTKPDQLLPNGEIEDWSLPQDSRIRKANYELSYGQRPDRQKVVAKIKPFFKDDENPRMYDWLRVFGIAISSARPNEMCDIKIQRQSM